MAQGGRFGAAKKIVQQQEDESNNELSNFYKNLSKSVYVGFYGRVSSDEEQQLRSLRNQQEMFGYWMLENPEWQIYEMYLDEGITGLNLFKRDAFKKFINDAKAGKFQVAMIKSVSRFGRNMADTTAALDMLISIGVRVIFVEERIDSNNSNDLEKFGLFAWLAELESRKISDRVLMTFDKMQKEGYYFGSKAPYGYTREKGKLYINEEEAIVVKQIYRMYLEDCLGYSRIRNKIQEMKILNPMKTGFDWRTRTIILILTNPVYTGDTYTKQTKTVEIKSRKRIINSLDDWLYFPNTHEAIIDKEYFEKVTKEMERRTRINQDIQDSVKIPKRKDSSKNLFSGLIVCGRCGTSYVRKTIYQRPSNKAEEKAFTWRCKNYEHFGKSVCTSESVHEKILTQVMSDIFRGLKEDKSKIAEIIKAEKKKTTMTENTLKHKRRELENESNKILKKTQKLLELYTDDEITKEEYLESSKPLNIRIANIKEELENLKSRMEEDIEITNDVQNLVKDLDTLADTKKWTNELLKRNVEAIIIHTKTNIEVILKLNKSQYAVNLMTGIGANLEEKKSGGAENESENADYSVQKYPLCITCGGGEEIMGNYELHFLHYTTPESIEVRTVVQL